MESYRKNEEGWGRRKEGSIGRREENIKDNRGKKWRERGIKEDSRQEVRGERKRREGDEVEGGERM